MKIATHIAKHGIHQVLMKVVAEIQSKSSTEMFYGLPAISAAQLQLAHDIEAARKKFAEAVAVANLNDAKIGQGHPTDEQLQGDKFKPLDCGF